MKRTIAAVILAASMPTMAWDPVQHGTDNTVFTAQLSTDQTSGFQFSMDKTSCQFMMTYFTNLGETSSGDMERVVGKIDIEVSVDGGHTMVETDLDLRFKAYQGQVMGIAQSMGISQSFVGYMESGGTLQLNTLFPVKGKRKGLVANYSMAGSRARITEMRKYCDPLGIL